MKIIKRNGEFVEFDKNKIIRAINKALLDIDNNNNNIDNKDIENIALQIEQSVNNSEISFTVENIQDEVVKYLMDINKDLAIKYQSYRTVREGKRNFEKLYEEKIGQLLGKDKSIVNENANKDSKTISVQRDLLAGISSKNYYLNNILPKELKEAHEKGEIHIHDLDYLLFKETNCLGRETEFVTSDGIKSFKDFENGDKIMVFTPYGNWKPATVKSYGEKQLYKITFKKNGKTQIVRATDNHRWLLKDGTVTTSLKVGDHLLNPKSNFDDLNPFDLSKENKEWFCKGFICGDGSLRYSRTSKILTGNLIRLCGNKNKFLNIFLEVGFHIQHIEDNGDYILYIGNKEDWKTTPKNFYSVDNIQSWFLGLLEADGRKSTSNTKTRFNSIYTKDEKLQEFIRQYLPVAQIWSTSYRDYSGQETNLGKRNGSPIEFNLTTYKSDYRGNEWKVISIEEDSFEDVWCLEVEDDKSFVLKNGITTGNCELVDLARMLKGGCKIGNAKMLEPNSIDVAVGHTVQIIASVSSNTYGGCTIPYIDMTLVPYVRKTFMKHFFNGYKFLYGTEVNKEEFLHDTEINYFASDDIWENVYDYLMREYNKVFNYAIELTEESVKQAMQGLEYEINSLSTVNGQTPFTTVGFGTETSWEGRLVQKYILKTRLSGFGAKKEVAVFPKLVFAVADGINFKPEDKNWDIAQIAFECMTKSIYPDILFVTKEQCKNKTVVYPMGK